MQEEKLKKGNNKVLLISIIAVIAVLFLSAVFIWFYGEWEVR